MFGPLDSVVDGAVVAAVVTGEIVVAMVEAGTQLFFASSPARSMLPVAADEADCATTCAMPSETSCASMMADTF